MKKILKGHVSPETAYLVNDYPYGYTLRCKIRYWLESNKHGTRMVSQTSNPKLAGFGGDVWNKPKASTYAKFAGCMYLDDEEHVHWTGLDVYTTAAEAEDWLTRCREGLCDLDLDRATAWVTAKKIYEAGRDGGKL
jgi:hypothetical protein